MGMGCTGLISCESCWQQKVTEGLKNHPPTASRDTHLVACATAIKVVLSRVLRMRNVPCDWAVARGVCLVRGSSFGVLATSYLNR